MTKILAWALMTVVASAPLAAIAGANGKSEPSANRAAVQNDIALRMARIHSFADLHDYEAANRGQRNPLSVLSPTNRQIFLDSLTFNERGITGFNYAALN